MYVLEIKGLSKHFGDKTVLNGLDLSVPEHSIFGINKDLTTGKSKAR